MDKPERYIRSFDTVKLKILNVFVKTQLESI